MKIFIFLCSVCILFPIMSFGNDLVSSNRAKWIAISSDSKRMYLEGNIDNSIGKAHEALVFAMQYLAGMDEVDKSKNNLSKLYLVKIKKLLWNGNYAKAVSLSGTAIGIASSDSVKSEFYVHKATALLHLGKTEDSLLNFNNAIGLNPQIAHYFIGRAGVYVKLACLDWKLSCELNSCDEYNQAKQTGLCD